MTRIRCAIYTRKSSEEGLDQAFNSLDAQRDACEAYVQSQRHEGWKAVRDRFDDGGLSGGTLERPALQRLMAEIDAGRIDMVVVYKIDRLTRSLADFAKLVDRLDAARASFVSVTQQFNTSTSMGRLTLNLLLSFAQFEREVTAERIRDKIAASKKKGIWMGGRTPLGYDKAEAGLVVNAAEAETVRKLFEAYLEPGCVRRLKAFADKQGLRTKTRTTKHGVAVSGVAFSRGRLYHLLRNPIYIGRIPHKMQSYERRHIGIVDQSVWDGVQDQLQTNRVARASRDNARHKSPLAGKVFSGLGEPLTPSHACKSDRRYRYYVSRALVTGEGGPSAGMRLPAQEVERAVLDLSAKAYAQTGSEPPDRDGLFRLVKRVEIRPGALAVVIDLSAVGEEADRRIETTFTLKRRGVETRLVHKGDVRPPDSVLVRRVIRAMGWVDQIKRGASISDVAKADRVSGEFVTQNIDAGFLSPALLDAVIEGRQPPHLTAKRLTRLRLASDWRDQIAQIDA